MSVAVVGIGAMTLCDVASGGDTLGAGVALVVAATPGIALGNALTRRFAAEVDPIAAATVQLLPGAVPLIVLAVLTEPWTPQILEPRFVALIAVLGLGGAAVRFTLWIVVLKDCPLNTANVVSFLAPLMAVAISVVFLGEGPAPLAASGMVLTIAGIGLAARPG